MTSSRVTAATARSTMPPSGASESTRLVAASTAAAAPTTAAAASVHRRARVPPRGSAVRRLGAGRPRRASPSGPGLGASAHLQRSRFDVATRRRLEGGQLRREPSARTVEPDGEGGPGATGGTGRAGGGEPFPGDEHQRLPVALGEPGERRARDLGFADALTRITGPGRHRRGRGEPPLEGEATVGRPARVGQHAACDAVEPRERVLGHVVEPPPGDEKRLGHHVGRHVGRSATKRIAADGRIVLAEDALESLIAGRLHEPVLCLEYVRQGVGDYAAQPVRVSAVSRPAVPGRPTARIADRRSATCLVNPPDVLRRAAGPVLLRRCYELRRRLPAPANPWAALRTGPPRRGAAFTVGQSPPNAV